eukprot:gene11948-13184_t
MVAEDQVFDNLVQEFCELTQCTASTGNDFIKRHQNNLQSALNDFFEHGLPEHRDVVEAGASNDHIKMITWNIDGLDERDFNMRMMAVIVKINTLQPEIVYLQEVLQISLQCIRMMCKGYTVHHHARAGYFCATLIKQTTRLEFISKKILEYPGSTMGRYLLCINIKYDEHQLLLLNTHLESTKDEARQRKVQLNACFDEIKNSAEDVHVILAGDLNIRDREIQSIGGLPGGVLDAWVETGSDPLKEFSWDVGENDNLNWPFKHRPKLRFDRILYKSGVSRKMEVSAFNLIGKERLESCGRFPSDHWGIHCEFALKS